MTRAVFAYLATGLVLLPADILWLRTVGGSFFKARLGHLLADEFRLAPILLFYLLYFAGIVIFVLLPSLASGSWRTALLYGCLFGFFCYATYDLTNLATLRDWPLSVALVDIAWGTGMTGLAAAIAHELTARFGPSG